MAEPESMAAPAVKKTAAKKATHPTYLAMAKDAIVALGDKKGATVPAIQSFIAGKYTLDAETVRLHLKAALAKGIETGVLQRPKNSDAKGFTGRFKLNKDKAMEEEKANKQKEKVKLAKEKKKEVAEKAAKKTKVGTKSPAKKKTDAAGKPKKATTKKVTATKKATPSKKTTVKAKKSPKTSAAKKPKAAKATLKTPKKPTKTLKAPASSAKK